MFQGLLTQVREKQLRAALVLLLAMLVLLRVLRTHTLDVYFAGFLLILLVTGRHFSFRAYGKCLRQLKHFWLPMLLTTAALFLLRYLREYLVEWFQTIHINDNGRIAVYTTGSVDYVLFGITMMLLAPLAEGLLFRSDAVLNKDKRVTALLVACSVLLQFLLYVEKPVGILYVCLSVLPLTLSFLVTKNTYVPLTAHVIFAIYDNIPFVIYAFARMAYS